MKGRETWERRERGVGGEKQVVIHSRTEAARIGTMPPKLEFSSVGNGAKQHGSMGAPEL
jgi:hypothetical protein